jgi:N-acetylglucosaminyl-diphospho-decaprenol L-rhamnosyltransferase
MTLTVSIVSHGHGPMLEPIIGQLLGFPEVTQVILTYNIPEPEIGITNERLLKVCNKTPRGFGANHNAAFKLSRCDQFCVLNPDVIFTENPFPVLLEALKMPQVSLAVPRVTDQTGQTEDSLRAFITPISILKRVLGLNQGTYTVTNESGCFYPDWAAGMFMLLDAPAYASIKGFDERYFMYCEDADICTRLWAAGHRIIACPSVSVIHPAQRASHRNVKHIVWHINSLCRYLWQHRAGLPKKSQTKG